MDGAVDVVPRLADGDTGGMDGDVVFGPGDDCVDEVCVNSDCEAGGDANGLAVMALLTSFGLPRFLFFSAADFVDFGSGVVVFVVEELVDPKAFLLKKLNRLPCLSFLLLLLEDDGLPLTMMAGSGKKGEGVLNNHNKSAKDQCVRQKKVVVVVVREADKHLFVVVIVVVAVVVGGDWVLCVFVWNQMVFTPSRDTSVLYHVTCCCAGESQKKKHHENPTALLSVLQSPSCCRVAPQ